MAVDRDRAFSLLREYNKDEGHLRHALAVEACMRHFACKAGEDEDLWGVVGLLHDLDWEMVSQEHPEKHTAVAAEILEKEGYPEEIVRAIQSHGWGICSDVEPRSTMEKTLYTVDELTGLIMTCALVRPSRSLSDLTVKSVKKKWKDKRFAAGVDRKLIERGAAMMDIEISELIGEVIQAMCPVQSHLGLQETNGD
ncbi:MAG: hydrolase [Dethiosulfovibrio peptidovorans]|nr:MAG: hydrolase [Dethiosulfovibrio peptidovorans]